MNKANRITLAAIYDRPKSATFRWSDIERLGIALVGTIEKRTGNRVWIEVNGVGAVFHRPKPQTRTYAEISDVFDFSTLKVSWPVHFSKLHHFFHIYSKLDFARFVKLVDLRH
jgi:hypothetical protein